VAASFIAAFPNIEVFMDDLVVDDGVVEYQAEYNRRLYR
jgi:hypothetical protein